MAMDDAQFADRLDRFLDTLSNGIEDPANGSSPDHEFAATVRRLNAHDDAPPAHPHFADRLLEDLMHATTAHDPSTILINSALPAGLDRDLPARIGSRRIAPWLGWSLRQAATTALVLLALVGSIIVVGPLRPRNAAWLPVLPAISGTPAVTDEIVIETLIDVPDAPLPVGPVQLYAGFTELQPGVSAALGGQVGTSSYYIEQGTVRISHASEEKILQAGERWSSTQSGDWGLENVGDDMARIIQADVNDALQTSSVDANTNSKFSDPEGYADIFVIQAASTLPPGMGRITLERMMLPPGAAMAPYPKQEFQWIGVATGRVGATLAGDRLPFRWDSGEERTFGLFQTLPAIQPGTRMTLRNADKVPLVLYRLTIVPDDVGGSSATTQAP